MNPLIQLKQTTSVFLVAFGLACFGLSPKVQAVSPAPDGCYPNFTTVEGCNALQSLTTGAGNTALGWRSLFSNATGNFNTGVGVGALVLNNADSNTALGAAALLLNTTGAQNTAVGTSALLNNTTGTENTALGFRAGINQGVGSNNIFIGDAGSSGDSNVIAIGNLPSSGTGYDSFFVGGVFGAQVDMATAVPVLIDKLGKLGTVAVAAAPGRTGARHQAMLNKSGRSKVEELQAIVAQQQIEIALLAAQLKDQAAQIQKVRAQLEVSKPAPQTVLNNH
jgi:hypothetical protein